MFDLLPQAKIYNEAKESLFFLKKKRLILLIATDHSQNSSFISFTLYLACLFTLFLVCNSLTESLVLCYREQAII